VHETCSTDQTRLVVRNYLGRHYLRAVFEKDAGRADALNRGGYVAAGLVAVATRNRICSW
jgi:hypothetical protein